MLKKLSCIAIAVILVFALMPMRTQAAAAPGFTVENRTVAFGHSFTLDVALVDNPGIISLRIQVEYDPTFLELELVEDLGLLKGLTEPVSPTASPYVIRWADALAPENNTANGPLVRLHFRAVEAIGTTNVAVKLIESRNYNGEQVSFATGRSQIRVHNLVEKPATPPDHTHTGNIQYWYCNHCGMRFADAYAVVELKPSDTEIPSPGHQFGDQWIFNDTYHWHSCECGVVSDHEQHLYSGNTDATCDTCGYIRPLAYLVGDINNDNSVTDSDAIYLLRHTLFGEDYPISQPADFNRDGSVTDSDAIYLLRHTLFGEDYPLDPM